MRVMGEREGEVVKARARARGGQHIDGQLLLSCQHQGKGERVRVRATP